MDNEKLLHKVLLDSQQFKAKPKGSTPGYITNRLTNCETAISIESLATALSSGQTFTPATFGGKPRSNGNWVQQSIFALDIDNKDKRGKKVKDSDIVDLQTILNRCNEYQLIPAFIYETFSHKDTWPKYRIVFQLEKPVTDPQQRRDIGNQLLFLFPESDNTFDESRLFYGGKNLVFERYEYYLDLLNLKNMALSHGLNITEKTDQRNVTRILKRRSKSLGITLGFDGNEYRPKVGEIKNVDYNLIAQNVRIFNDFLNGVKLLHPQLVGIASNLTKLKGGLDLFVKVIKSNPAYAPEKIAIASYARLQRWIPSRLEDWDDEYPEDHVYGTLEVAARDTKPKRLEKPNYITDCKGAREIMPDIVKRYIEDGIVTENRLMTETRLIKVPTGIGKTHSLCEYLSTEKTGTIIYAHPTHRMKRDAVDKLLEFNPSARYCVTPDPQHYLDADQYRIYKRLQTTGKHNDSARMLRDLAEKDMKVAQYFDDLKECFESEDNVFTTHAMAIHNGEKFKGKTILIFDEDPTSALMPIQEVLVSEIEKLSELTLVPDVARANLKTFLFNLRNTVMLGEVVETKNPFSTKKLAKDVYSRYSAHKDTFTTPVMDLFSSTYWQRDCDDGNGHYNADLIRCITKRPIPKNIKRVVIASATASAQVLGLLLNKNVTDFDLTEKVEPASIVKQDLSLTGSKSSIKRNLAAYNEKINELNPNAPVISHKDVSLDNQVSDMYFGNCAGYDDLKGKDLTVVGTLRYNPHTIALQAACCGYRPTFDDYRKVSSRRVKFNGFFFYISFLFEQPLMAELVMRHMSAEAQQALGRSRYNVIEDLNVVMIGGVPDKHHHVIGIDI